MYVPLAASTAGGKGAMHTQTEALSTRARTSLPSVIRENSRKARVRVSLSQSRDRRIIIITTHIHAHSEAQPIGKAFVPIYTRHTFPRYAYTNFFLFATAAALPPLPFFFFVFATRTQSYYV